MSAPPSPGSPTALFGAVEAGGTKVVCLVGTAPGDIAAEARIPTTDPSSTLAAVTGFFASAPAVRALGVASFGPLERRPGHARFGRITETPKPGWSDTDVVGPLRAALGVPVAFDTDVNGAALAEGRWGAARGLDDYVYLTVGTGVGLGVVAGGRPVHGVAHPEGGHVPVRRLPGDTFPGACPYHGDCLEGMTSGPALEARHGRRGEDLRGADLARAVEIEAAYLASGLRGIVYTLAPRRIVLGGGAMRLPGLLAAVRSALATELGGYPGLAEYTDDAFVSAAGSGPDAGALGALLMARELAGGPADGPAEATDGTVS